MDVRSASIDEFFQAFPKSGSIYSSRGFLELNAPKAEELRFFVGYDEAGRARLGTAAGKRDGQWLAPFSAPFTDICHEKSPSIEKIQEFFEGVTSMLKGVPLRITLPPEFYDASMLPKFNGVLANFAPRLWFDYNYHYDLSRFPRFSEYMGLTARQKYRQAIKEDFRFEKTGDIDRAYAVIKANRESHGYPLAMSLEDVKNTVRPLGPVESDFFLLTLDGADVAAAMVHHVVEGIVQVVYWGDAPGYSRLRPMNLLPYHLFGHYHALGYRIVDIGPSSSQGVPSLGLCRFKESLGCTLTLKPSYRF